MEVDDNSTDLLKKKRVENGDTDDHAVDKSPGKSPKKSIHNGLEKDAKDVVVKNGDHSRGSGLDSNSDSNSQSANAEVDDVSDKEEIECQKGHENGVEGDESGEMSADIEDSEDGVESKNGEADKMSTTEEVTERVAENEKSDQENEVEAEVDGSDGEVVDEEDGKGSDEDCVDLSKDDSGDKNKNSENEDEEMPQLVKEGSVDEKSDSEKENSETQRKESKVQSENSASDEAKSKDAKDSGNDDVEIIGESTVVKIDSPSLQKSSSSVILMTSGLSPNFPNSSPVLSTNSFSPIMANMPPGFMMNGRGIGNPVSLLPQQTSHAPPKPKSSLDQIELIRWEIQNRLNTRPKYFKPNPSAELGPLAKFLFDIGSNLIKEAVYHELVKIQSKKNDENTLSGKEKEDLEKLKDIERDLHGTIGHLKLKMRKKCKVCHFQTESGNVIYHHKQFPHEDGKILHCTYCTYLTKQPMNFKFHMESEHGVQPRLHDRKAFYECDLCPYENNQEPKLNIHKQRCLKQFRPLFNLHPSCLSGAEINLCLENIFYKPVVPKNLKILQAKHAQQQAALAEARRQQAEVQALAAQKNAAALVAKRQRQIAPVAVAVPQRYNGPTSRQLRPQPIAPNLTGVRYNSRPQLPAQGRNTVASMLKDRKEPTKPAPHVSPAPPNNAPGGFEVCEICGGYVKDRKALRIHFFYAHRIDLPFNLFDRNQPPLYCATCYVRFWTAQGLRKHIDVHVQEKKVPDNFMGEGVHGKCISCGQLVGNIVVHMRVVHNREIHHYINALMCMFCGASFNNRPNVERHIAEVHGTIDIATGAVKVKPKMKSNPPPPRPAQAQKKSSSGGKDSLVKGSVCVLCNLNFGRNVDLTRHCMRMHHTCMKCGMVVIDKASLLKHTCLSSPSGTRDCTMCSETGFHPAYYVKHLRDKHLKKFSITVARVSAPIIEKWIKRPYPFTAREDDPVEISDSEEEAPEANEVQSPKSPSIAEGGADGDTEGSPKKKVRIGPASKIGRKPLTGNVSGGPSPSGSQKRKMSEATPERMSKRRR